MKIWGDIPKVVGTYDKKMNLDKTEKTSKVASKKDVVSISSQAKDFQTVMKAIKDIPDVRQDKVESIREKYEAGTYDVKESDIAEKILKSIAEKKV